ncbi:4Fe-4S dicluster domain-containing protein [Anaeromyxobacter oryzae]|uniref:(Fe-S)-binding protein n=1 Tax=Anaeromyxobacter oryzae TaxID=2918170 RepID=A0ABN6N0R9_9BACT|nr:4Fe-4S dicluster domain-containing protein [Anaeromyxobacter oryzae]BDG05598.1 (Fe-S)-binding protein [Anaeromyxobacter oryzae]
MGHLHRLKQQYSELVERLGAGSVAMPEPDDARARQGWQELLEILFTPEEAALASRLPVRPMTLGALATRLGTDAATLRARLEPLCDKGIVLDVVDPRGGEPVYVLAPPVVGFFEFSLMRTDDGLPKKRLSEAYEAYMHGDDTFAREALGGDTSLGRALVHESKLADEPMPDVLDWERASEVVSSARAWSVTSCYCRHKALHLGRACDAPMEICMSLNGGAEFVARRGFGRAVERSEALEVLAAARERGLVQICDNVQRTPAWLCNCCGCCCELLAGITRYDLAAVNPSGFLPRRDPDRCAGCSRCARACPVGAITMVPVREPGTRKNELAPVRDDDRCIGCGVCADACLKHALVMARSERPRVPVNAVERAVRMSLERGRLAELLVDGGDRLGARFLRRALSAITNLPPAKQLLATEQVRSRFVRAALSRT